MGIFSAIFGTARPRYDEEKILQSVIARWEGENFCILPYYTKRSGRNNEVTQFVLDFKEARSEAVTVATKLVVNVLATQQQRFRDLRWKYVVAVPPSSKGFAKPASESICKIIAAHFGLTHLPGALERVTSVAKSSFAPPGQRPDAADHLESIRYVGPRLQADNSAVVLFDDVLTRGETSNACRMILKKSTGCQRVIGIFLSRTQ